MADGMSLRCAGILVLCASALAAADGERYLFLPKEPKWLTANLDVRDAADVLWPNLIGGRNASGEVVLDAEGVSGGFVVRFGEHSQIDGGQSRRVLGDAVRGKPVAELTVRRIAGAGATLNAAAELDQALAGPAARPEPPKTATIEGELTFLGRSVPVAATVRLARSGEKLVITGEIPLAGTLLGLATERLVLSFGVAGYLSSTDQKRGPGGPDLDLDLNR